MISKENSNSAKQTLLKRNIKSTVVILCVFFSFFVNGQIYHHHLYVRQKNDTGMKEIKMVNDDEIVGLWQYRKDATLAFELYRKINSATEHDVKYMVDDDRMHTVLSASSRSGFIIFKKESEERVKRLYVNDSPIKDVTKIDDNIWLNQVRKITDSTSLLENKNIKNLLDQPLELTTVHHLNKDGKIEKSYHYSKGKLLGVSKPPDEDHPVTEIIKPDGSGMGVIMEYEDGLLIRNSTGEVENFYGYNKDRKKVLHTTYKNGKLIFETRRQYQDEQLITQEFSNFEKNRKIIYTFTYNEKGKYQTMTKTDGKKVTVYHFHYTYW